MGRRKSQKRNIVKKLVNAFNNKTIIAIDPATHSLAFSVFVHKDGSNYLKACGKINMKNCTVTERFIIINAFVPLVIDNFAPNILVIEQPIYIQNFQTSRLLSYVVGHTWGRFTQENIEVMDIGPMQWKAGIGYKKVSAEEKRVWALTMSPTELKKKVDFERKNRVRFILQDKIDIENIDDHDIIDAIGIGYWAINGGYKSGAL
jgi:Holliday junction resolvasome RuvABC endonuclease subunit